MATTEMKIEDIMVPDVRVTAAYSEQLEEELRQSIKKMGVLNPISVVQVKGRAVLVDGLHRVLACRALKKKTIPVVKVKGKMKDNLLMNMVMNRMRGSTEPSQMLKVVAALKDEYKMSYKAIEEATGLSKGYISQLIRVAEASEDLRRMVDAGEIDVQKAYQIAQIPDQSVQGFVADQVVRLKMGRDETRAFVKSVKLETEKPKEEQRPLEDIPTATSECQLCHTQHRPGVMVCPILCPSCYGAAAAFIEGSMAGTPPESADGSNSTGPAEEN
jgi:ParB family chromosome partitioning protein